MFYLPIWTLFLNILLLYFAILKSFLTILGILQLFIFILQGIKN